MCSSDEWRIGEGDRLDLTAEMTESKVEKKDRRRKIQRVLVRTRH